MKINLNNIKNIRERYEAGLRAAAKNIQRNKRITGDLAKKPNPNQPSSSWF
jgi:predicted DNA-binding protein (UPF0278 family)